MQSLPPEYVDDLAEHVGSYEAVIADCPVYLADAVTIDDVGGADGAVLDDIRKLNERADGSERTVCRFVAGADKVEIVIAVEPEASLGGGSQCDCDEKNCE